MQQLWALHTNLPRRKSEVRFQTHDPRPCYERSCAGGRHCRSKEDEMSKPVGKFLLLSAVLALSLPAFAVEDQAISDDSLGLSKTSVYDDPSPIIVNFGAGDPGTNKRAVKSYHTAPPMITHTIVDMVPITRDSNLCKDCHVQPDLLKQKIVQGMPIPAPA